MFTGLILAESLKDEQVLSLMHVVRREVWDVGPRAADFQPTTWNAIFVEGEAGRIEEVAEALSRALIPRWYANLSTADMEYVVFPGRIFTHLKGDRSSAAEAMEYGRSLGIPEHQLDWVG